MVLDYFEEGRRQLKDQRYYEKLDHNPTKEHKEIVTKTIQRLAEEDDISEETAAKLIPSNWRTPVFYLLPKVHKEGCPGRPVVSSVKCHTEKISAYVDEKLRPIVTKLTFYIKDTSDFVNKVRNIGKVPEESYLVTMDVTGLYTNIDHSEGLDASMQKTLEQENRDQKPLANSLTLLMRLILVLNNFVFNNVNYIQRMGTAMGTRSAPSFSNIFMGDFEQTFVYICIQMFVQNLPWRCCWMTDDVHQILGPLYRRHLFYMDWKPALKTFINYMNNVHPTIKFTAKYSEKAVNFLDTTVEKSVTGELSTDVYQKQLTTLHICIGNQLMTTGWKSIPYTLRLRRICQNDKTIKKRIQQYSEYFVACEYKRTDIHKEMRRVETISHEEALKPKEKTQRDHWHKL